MGQIMQKYINKFSKLFVILSKLDLSWIYKTCFLPRLLLTQNFEPTIPLIQLQKSHRAG